MSLEKNFQSESQLFLFVCVALFTVLYGVLGFVFACLACASMLFSVKFHVAKREVWMLQETTVWMLGRFCGKRNFRRRREQSL